MKTRFLRSALAAVLVTSTAAPLSAQVLTSYNNGDIFLGFRRDGTANTLAVNLGSARQFLTTAQGGTNDSTAPFKVRFGVVPGTSTAVTNLSTDLAAVFGANWTTNKTDGTSVRWGVAGISGNTSSGIPNYTARTLFITRARTAPGTPTEIPGDRLEIGDYDTFSSAFTSFVQGVGGGSFRNQNSTANSSAAYIGPSSDANNWGTRINEASEGSFGLGSGYEVEQTFGAFSGPTDSVLDLWISPNEGSTAIPENQNTYLGYFTLSTTGELTFTPAGSVTAPTIAGFTPTSGPAGTSVAITGTGLSGATSVTFNGVTAAITANTATQITATAPASATTGKIAVTTAGGTATSTADFTVTAPVPTLSNFSPLSGAVGSTVVITGANLSGATAVSFNNVAAAVFSSDSATQITATVPASATTGKIAVTTAGGTATSLADFTVTVPVNPTLTTYANGDIFLGFRRTGTADTLAVNLGSARQFLTTAQGGTNNSVTPFKVRFGVVPGSSTEVNNLAADLATVFGSNWATNKADGSSVRWAVVGLSGNTSSGIAGYTARTLFVTRARTATNTPTIIPADRLDIGDFDSFSSSFNSFVQGVGGGSYKNQFSTLNSSVAYVGPASDDNNWGTRINEAAEGSFGLGANLEVEQTFGSFSGPTDSVLDLWISPNEGSTAIPVNQNTYLGFFTLNNAGELTFTPKIATDPPTITNFTPGSGPVGTSVTITGTGFTGATSVTFNGVSATAFTVNSFTQITATVPATATTGKIVVTTPNGSVTSTNNYTVTLPAPVITSATTASGKVGQAFSYQIAASNSPTSFNATGLPAGLTVDTSTGAITGTPSASGTFSVSLSATNAGGTGTATLTITIAPPSPTITSFTPDSGVVGTSVVVTGTGFTGATSVTFNGVSAATFAVDSATQITVTVPATATTGKITVTTPNGSVTSTNDYTVTLPAPVISGFAPGSGTVGTQVAITGTGFTGATAVTFNGVNSTNFTTNNATQITATVPLGATTGKIVVTTLNGSFTNSNDFSVLLRPVITSATTATGRTDQTFTYNTGANNSPTAFSATGLPAGLSINATTGVISGKPTKVGTFTVVLAARNAAGIGPNTTLALTIRPPAPVITVPSKPPVGRVGQPFSLAIAANNSPTGFSATGLPTGLSINAATGVISGTPNEAGTFNVTLSATNATGTGTATLRLTMNPPPPVILITGDNATRTAIVGRDFIYQVPASNSPTSYAATGLPAGLKIDTKTGVISGKPTRTGSSTVSLSASNASGKGQATLNLIVITAPAP